MARWQDSQIGNKYKFILHKIHLAQTFILYSLPKSLKWPRSLSGFIYLLGVIPVIREV